MMSAKPSLSLVVIRVSDIDRSAEFYSAIGIAFDREQHGNGPLHLAGLLGDTVFELYPASERSPVTSLRLGFSVESINAVIERCQQAGHEILSQPTNSPWGLRAVVADPDGHKIELNERRIA